MELAAELQASLQEFVASGVVEVRESGGRVAPFSGMCWEVRGAGEKPFLHLWSEQFQLTRRVLAITDHSEHRLALAVERFGRSKPDRLEFIRKDFERSARELSREEFRDRLTQLLAEQFPDETLESLTVAPDLEHSLSGNYARGVLRRGSEYIALLAVPDGESSDTADNSLTFALLWLLRSRKVHHRGTIRTLRILLPNHRAKSQRTHSPAFASRGLLAAGSAPFAKRRNQALRLFSGGGIATDAATGLPGCAGAAIPSFDRRDTEIPLTGT